MVKGASAIKPNGSFLLDGVNVFKTGDFTENETWNTYGFTFTTKPGHKSLTHSLRNNAPGGIANEQTEGWDGTLNGRPVGNMVYIYTISILFINGEVVQYS